MILLYAGIFYLCKKALRQVSQLAGNFDNKNLVDCSGIIFAQADLLLYMLMKLFV